MAERLYFAFLVVVCFVSAGNDETGLKHSNRANILYRRRRWQHNHPVENISYVKGETVAIPPDFMLELYNSISANSDTTSRISAENKLPSTIRCIFGQAQKGKDKYFFNISGVPADEYILSAKIHVELVRGDISAQSTRLYIFLINQRHKKATQVVRTRHKTREWVEFPVRSLLKRWIHFPRWNQGVSLRCNETQRSIIFDKKPMLVVYTSYKQDEFKTLSTWMGFSKMTARRPPSRVTRSDHAEHLGTCSRRTMQVNTEELNWNWVILPRQFNLFSCEGLCRFPISNGEQANNHAVVQSIVSSAGINKEVGDPCCIPVKLGAMSLMYSQPDGSIAMKFFQGMVATECGCR